MSKKIKDSKDTKSDELKKVKDKESSEETSEKITEKSSEKAKGRKEDDYFFPDKRVTVKASSQKEALKKIKDNE